MMLEVSTYVYMHECELAVTDTAIPVCFSAKFDTIYLMHFHHAVLAELEGLSKGSLDPSLKQNVSKTTSGAR